MPKSQKADRSFQLSINFGKVCSPPLLAKTRSEFGKPAIAMVTLAGTVAIARLVALRARRRMTKYALGSIGVIANSRLLLVWGSFDRLFASSQDFDKPARQKIRGNC
jgi:hypothetical protein